MASLPQYKIEVYGNDDVLPEQAESLFAKELADSREPLPADRPDRDQWRFACICAVTQSAEVLGGAHMDMGPVNFGPLSEDKLAYLEQLIVREEYRQQGLGTELLKRLVEVAKDEGCQYIRYNVHWDNPAAIAVAKKCGFALTDVEEEGGRYFTVKPLQGHGCRI
jgi:RimJ/RimL family protein N-acetyltransferase